MWLMEIAQILNKEFDGRNSQVWDLSIPVKEYSLFEVWVGSWFDGNAANAYHYWNMQHNFDNTRSREVLGLEYARDPKDVLIESANDFINSGAVNAKRKDK